MRLTLWCIVLLMLLICCWQCMGMPKHGKKRPSPHETSSAEDSSSKEKKDSSSSDDSSSSKGKDSSSSDDSSSSKEKGRSCTNGKRNKKETDIDCGGKKCSPCIDGKKCLVNRDCVSQLCKNGRCTQRPTKKPSTKKTTQAITTTPTAEPKTTTPEAIITTPAEPSTTPEELSTTPEELSTTPEEPSTTPEEPSTTPEELSTTPEELSTTPEEPSTTPEELSTTPEELSTTPEELSTTPEEPSTTPEELSTTPEEPSTTPEEAPEAPIEALTAKPICNPECQNGGKCVADNICTCPADFSGPTCEVQSVGLCLDKETFDVEPILKVTFGKGSRQFSLASPAKFNFTTTYTQRREPTIDDGYFAFINSIYNHHNAWHTGAKDHTGDEDGYMYVVNANFEPGQFYSSRVDNLCVGLRYEFSVYLANLCKKAGRIDPNVLFEVRSVDGSELLAQLNSGNVPERDTLTWEKYGVSFIATHSSVNLLMISNTRGGSGNDIVIDDIALRVCANKGSGFCPSK